MKSKLTLKIFALVVLFSAIGIDSFSQQIEWRLVNPTYSGTDPDGAGDANGIVTFTLQARTTSGTAPNIDVIQTGFAYQSANAIVPVGCGPISNPSNVVLSSTLSSYNLSTMEQCNVVSQSTGGETFDRIASGSIEYSSGPRLEITTAWIDIFTVTLWSKNLSSPQGGYAIINSGSGGSPGNLPTYSISDNAAQEYVINSLTYTTPLALQATVLPVVFTKFNAQCNGNGTLISWATAQEGNSNKFEIERSIDGRNWSSIATVPAAGNSASERTYQQLDLSGGKALYRIKQTDKDGSFIYTNTESVNCVTRNITSVIYPVPAKDVLNVVIKSDRAVRTQLLVFDIAGKLMKKMDAQVTSGNNNFKIDLGGLTAGDYILKSSDAAIEINKVFTITR
jgi:hypothetical protein